MNGHLCEYFHKSNGLLQGLPSSCPLWLIYVEPFIRHLRDDPKLTGITIPGDMGLGTQQLTVAAYADDLKRYCASTAEVEHLATGPVAIWKGASGQIFAVEKFTVVLLGYATKATLPNLPVKAWQRYGTDETDKSLGIRVGTPMQVAEQWYATAA